VFARRVLIVPRAGTAGLVLLIGLQLGIHIESGAAAVEEMYGDCRVLGDVLDADLECATPVQDGITRMRIGQAVASGVAVLGLGLALVRPSNGKRHCNPGERGPEAGGRLDEQLAELDRLRDAGTVTPEEYNSMRRRPLGLND
jgi:hypothetical protein